MTAPLDLRELRLPFSEFLATTIADFRFQHPSEEVSAIVAYVFPYRRVAGLCFDTKPNSDAHVEKWKKNGPDWYGADLSGCFNDSPEDFAFADYADFEFQNWPDFYEAERKVQFLDHTGKLTVADMDRDGDEGLNRAIFPSICAFVRECEAWSLIRRSEPFRLGVAMHDSRCEAFWVVS